MIDNHTGTFSVSNSPTDFEKACKNRIKLYLKPYSLPRAKKLYENVRRLVESKIPNTRLKRLGWAPFQALDNGSLYRGSLECLNLFTRTRKDSQRQTIQQALEEFDCFSGMPWKKDNGSYSTVLVDLMELADFCVNHQAVSKGDNHAPSY
jgi:hypothetical protein